MLARLHRECLAELAGEGFGEYRLDSGQRAGALAAQGGCIDGITPASSAAVLARIERDRIDTVWLDGSNLGHLARSIKRARPAVRVIAFCHNVEARFFAGALRAAPSLHGAAVVFANWRAERLAASHADCLVALSERDSAVLQRLYGRAADHILPMAMVDQVSEATGDSTPVAADASLLFAGGAFYANRHGIEWFAHEVAPRIALRTQVVGRGMESLRAQLATANNVELIGAVDGLDPWYHKARAVIAPIFDGSGMKTKVAEALMYGKLVIGTPEAFSGYGEEACAAGLICETSDHFVAAIQAVAAQPIKALDPELRDIYMRHFSERAARDGIAAILAALAPQQVN